MTLELYTQYVYVHVGTYTYNLQLPHFSPIKHHQSRYFVFISSLVHKLHIFRAHKIFLLEWLMWKVYVSSLANGHVGRMSMCTGVLSAT